MAEEGAGSGVVAVAPASAAALVAAAERRFESQLETLSNALWEELSRLREHLLLMQSQVDAVRASVAKVAPDTQRMLDQEKQQRAMAALAHRESRDQLQAQIDELRERLDSLPSSSSSRTVPAPSASFSSLFWGGCVPAQSSDPNIAHHTLPTRSPRANHATVMAPSVVPALKREHDAKMANGSAAAKDGMKAGVETKEVSTGLASPSPAAGVASPKPTL